MSGDQDRRRRRFIEAADDGAIGDQHLRDFQDNDKTIPTILTTSQKLSTGVDARNIRNIVLMRPVNSMIEFKQIIGRGTRLYELPALFKDEDELRALWSDPATRKALLEALAEKGFGDVQLAEIKHLIEADKSDLYDVLAYIAFTRSPITREERVSTRKGRIFSQYQDDKLRAFLDFVLAEYVKEGVGELDQAKLTPLLELKYRAVSDAARDLGGIAKIRDTFIGFQKFLYADMSQR